MVTQEEINRIIDEEKFCDVCHQPIKQGESYEFHKYDNGYFSFWHYSCYQKGGITLVPLTQDSAKSLLEFMDNSFPDPTGWEKEVKKTLEQAI